MVTKFNLNWYEKAVEDQKVHGPWIAKLFLRVGELGRATLSKEKIWQASHLGGTKKNYTAWARFQMNSNERTTRKTWPLEATE